MTAPFHRFLRCRPGSCAAHPRRSRNTEDFVAGGTVSLGFVPIPIRGLSPRVFSILLDGGEILRSIVFVTRPRRTRADAAATAGRASGITMRPFTVVSSGATRVTPRQLDFTIYELGGPCAADALPSCLFMGRLPMRIVRSVPAAFESEWCPAQGGCVLSCDLRSTE